MYAKTLTRHTLKSEIEFSGLGIHTGKTTQVNIKPYTDGIVFEANGEIIPADCLNVVNTSRCTMLGSNRQTISTVEHLLASLYCCGVTDARICVDGPEIPILDGSAKPIVDRILQSGLNALAEQKSVSLDCALMVTDSDEFKDNEIPYLSILKENMRNYAYNSYTKPVGLFSVIDELIAKYPRFVFAFPSDESILIGEISFDNPTIGRQMEIFDFNPETIKEHIAPARTFGFKHEVDALIERGLAKGGTLDNALIIGDEGYLTPTRFENEPLRHKLLDLIGDAMLSRCHLSGVILLAVRTGHALNVKFARALRNIYFNGGKDGR